MSVPTGGEYVFKFNRIDVAETGVELNKLVMHGSSGSSG